MGRDPAAAAEGGFFCFRGTEQERSAVGWRLPASWLVGRLPCPRESLALLQFGSRPIAIAGAGVAWHSDARPGMIL